MAVAQLHYEPRRGFDAGLFVARYLQVLAWLSIAGIIAGPMFFDSFIFDPSFIFYFWAASALKRHSPAARLWVLLICGIGLAGCLLFLLIVIFSGTGGMTVSAGRGMHHPAWWQVLLAFLVGVGLVGIPFWVLMTKSARRQFEAG
jgi:hypothetical protein